MHVLKSGKEKVTLYYGNQTLNGAPYNHTGMDFVKSPSNLDYIVAAAKGKVVAVRKDVRGYLKGSYGNYVKLQHADGFETLYAHLEYGSVKVNVGDIVSEGQEIGYMGATGYAFGAHLHFEVRINGATTDPNPYMTGAKEIPGYGTFSPITPQTWVDYTIQPGDTLGKIAAERGTTPQEIAKYNGIITDINYIQVGWVIKVPPIQTNAPDTSLKAGDTVIVNGIGYAASDGSGAQTRPRVEQKMKLVKIVSGAKFPYACNQNMSMNGVTAYWSNVRKA